MTSPFSKLPDDVLVEILIRLPALEIVRGMAINKQWNQLANTHRFWVQKCIADQYLDQPEVTSQFVNVPLPVLIKCIVKRAFNRNLLDDDFTVHPPKLDSRWKNGQRNDWGRTAFQVESPPVFLAEMRTPELDENPEPFESCLVSSYTPANRTCVVDLADYGLDEKTLNELKPTIIATEFYANRADCGCQYSFVSSLSSSRKSKPCVQQTDKEIPQWEPQWWRKTEHEHKNYPKNVRFIQLTTSAQDTQFWSGNYGTKTAGTSLVVKFEFNQPN